MQSKEMAKTKNVTAAGFRLSPQQKRIWSLQSEDRNLRYRAQAVIRIKGSLNQDALRLAIDSAVRRFEILRTSYAYLPGMTIPVQRISEEAAWHLHHIDLRASAEHDRSTEIDSQLEQWQRQHLDLENGTPFFVGLINASQTEHILLIALPALCADKPSMKSLVSEIMRAYDAGPAYEESASEPMQYADIAEWQYELRESEHNEKANEFWSAQAIENGLALRAPFETRVLTSGAFEQGHDEICLDDGIARRIEAIAGEFDSSIERALLACWMILLWRLTGESKAIVGVAFDGRKYEELNGAIGSLETYLPTQARLYDELEFSLLLSRVTESASESYKWQEYFDWDRLDESRTVSSPPFFPVCFDFETVGESVRAGVITSSIQSIHSCSDRFKVKLSCTHDGSNISTKFHYDSALFEPEDIRRLADHFNTLLRSVCDDPLKCIGDFEILSDIERKRLVFELNNTSQEYPREKCAHHLFEEQRQLTPDNTAVIFKEQKLSYRELDERANKVARYLQRLAVGPEMLVGICIERSAEMVIGLLGILKAGAGYLPLDSSYPIDRLTYILNDADASVVLTQKAMVGRLPANGRKVLCIDADWEEIEAESGERVTSSVTPDNLAYVIYTSGSTGKPKGVMIPHRGVVNYLSFAVKRYGLRQSEGSLVHSPLGFDLTVTGLLGPLMAGGSVEIVEQVEQGEQIEEMVKALATGRRYSIVKMTPSHIEMVSAGLKQKGAKSKAQVYVIGGEALRWEGVNRLAEASEGSRVINEYGPTETVVGCSIREVEVGEQGEGEVEIGRPISNARMYVMDEQQRVVAVGVTGEIYIGGEGVGRGYVRRSEETAAVYVPDNVSGEVGGRLYRSGDKGKYTKRGEIEYEGRKDRQEKVRGYRIEKGEVESELRDIGGVKEAAVEAIGEGSDKRLVAYIVAEGGEEIKIGEIRRRMEERVPGYMVPGRYVILEEMPLSANGKIDYRALPALDKLQPEMQESYVAPRTLTEEVLAEIWADILGQERVGIDDNFFALGGDSIRSIQLRYKAQLRGLDIPHQKLFQNQTIKELARQIRFEDAGTLAIPGTAPFDLVSHDDRSRLPEGIADAYPLSLLQAGMIFHSEYSPEAPIFHDIHCCHLRAPFKLETLQLALSGLFSRHEVLRTSFALTGFSHLLQLVHKDVEIPLQVDDLRHLSHDEQEAEIASWMERDKNQHYDWLRPPLLRLHVHRRSEDGFQFALSFHHAILDGWSVATMLTELFQDYLRLLDEEARPIESPAITFRDYISLEQGILKSQEARQYWAETLEDCRITRLPRLTDSQEKGSDNARIELAQVMISRETSDGLKRLARSLPVPLKTALLAAHLKVLTVLAGNSDVITGYLSNGRPEDVDGDRVLGLFVNNLPFRLKISNGTWADLVQQVFDAEQKMQPYRLYPLAQIQQDHGGQQLFETGFTFLHYHVYNKLQDLESFKDVEVLSWESFEQTNFALLAYFSLDLTFSQVRLDLSYDSTQLSPSQAEAIGRYYSKALDSMAFESTAMHNSICLLSDEEQQQILFDWNDTRTDYRRDRTIHQLFEQQVEQTPDAVAVIFKEQKLSYRELDERANKVARYLQRLAVGPEMLVGICIERSAEMVIGLLGILKAGAGYLPLDSSYPIERLAFILEETAAPVLLTTSDLIERLPSTWTLMICVDSDWEQIEAESGERITSSVTPDNLAYVIYTSGSTGKPKGVMIPHRGVVNYLSFAVKRYGLRQSEGSLVHSPLGFDLTVTGLLGPLMAGGSVEMVEQCEQGEQIEEMVKALATGRRYSIVKMTPSHIEMVSAGLKQKGAKSKAQVYVIGGEALRWESVNRLIEVSEGSRVINEYGPTETVVGCSIREVGIEEQGEGEVEIGRPISNARMYVMDEQQRVVAVGVTGEIYIGGEGVGRGYVRRSEETAVVYVPDNVSGEVGGRLYRSGDKGKYTKRGEIEYEGRKDRQEKVRGYRIEKGEVESELRDIGGVKEAAVEAIGEGSDKRLVAYIATDQPHEMISMKLRQALSEKLPPYMLPSQFVVMKELPITPNGKIDRKSLAALETLNAAPMKLYIRPRTQIEELLAIIWTQVLGVDQVGIQDNFFERGGHSLRATQVIVRVRESFNLDLPLRTLFDSPTLEAFAQVVESALRSEHQNLPPRIARVPRGEEIPLSFAQQRLWFIHKLEPDSPAYNLPIGVRLNGPLDTKALEQTFSEIIRRHEALRTTFAEVNGQPAQNIAPAQPLILPRVDLSLLSEPVLEEEIRRLAVEETQLPFDLARGPLLRIRIVKAGEEDHVILATMHHIVSDGWSVGVLVREISALYDAYSNGLDSPLPELAIHYADYAQWQRQWLQGEVLQEQISYWKKQLAGAPPVLALSTDNPRKASAIYRAVNLNWNLPAPLPEQIAALNQQEGVTLFMTLLAAFNILLHHYTGQLDIVVGTDVANRTRSETEDLIGFFVNQLVLRTSLSGDPTFRQLLSRVRQVTVDAYTHQDLPFEKLVESLNPDRNLIHTPIFQVKLVAHNAAVPELNLQGLTLTPVGAPIGRAKYDMVLNAVESGQSLGGWLDYNSDLFNPATADRVLDDFAALLRNIVASPDLKISQLKQQLVEADQQHERAKEKALEDLLLQKLGSVKRRASLPQQEESTFRN